MKEEGFCDRGGDGSGIRSQENRALVQTCARHLVSGMGEDQMLMTPVCLENLPMSEETEETEWTGR
jgi:hypothetical protein